MQPSIDDNTIEHTVSQSATAVVLAGYVRRPPKTLNEPYAFLLQQTRALNHAIPVHGNVATALAGVDVMRETTGVIVVGYVTSMPIHVAWLSTNAKVRWIPTIHAMKISPITPEAHSNARIWAGGRNDASPVDEQFEPPLATSDSEVANNSVRIRGRLRHFYFEESSSATEQQRSRMVLMIATGPSMAELFEIRVKGSKAASMRRQFQYLSRDQLNEGVPLEVAGVIRSKVAPHPDGSQLRYGDRDFENVFRRPYIQAQNIIVDQTIADDQTWWNASLFGPAYVEQGRLASKDIDPILLGPVIPQRSAC